MPDPPLDTLATPVAWTDHAGVLLGCNPAFARWLGVSRRRLEGLPLASLDAEQGRLAALIGHIVADAEPLRVRRARLHAPGGAERFADVILARDEGGLRIEAHPADEFPGADPASALPAALHAALKGLAHEVRNPLAGLKGAAQLLARRASSRLDNDDERALIAVIGDEVDRLAALLERLVNPAPMRPFESLNIHVVLERVRMLADADAGWAIRLDRDYDPSLPSISGDPDRLTQALWNLLRNALESGANTVTLWRADRRSRAPAGLAHRSLRQRARRPGRPDRADLPAARFWSCRRFGSWPAAHPADRP